MSIWRRAIVFGFVLSLAGLSGCGSSNTNPLGAGGAKYVYVAAEAFPSLEILRLPAVSTGKVAPTSTLSLRIANPATHYIAVDSAGQLYVLDGTTIYIYAAGASGNTAPTRSFTMSINQVIIALTVDSSGMIYVADLQGNIYVYPASATGTAVASRMIRSQSTGTSEPASIAIDGTGAIYFTTETLAGYAIEVFAPGATGHVAPIRTITGLLPFTSVSVDASGNIFAEQFNFSASTSTIEKFSATANGAATPISSFTFADPALGSFMQMDSAGNFFVASAKVANAFETPFVFVYKADSSGSPSPIESISSQGWNQGTEIAVQ